MRNELQQVVNVMTKKHEMLLALGFTCLCKDKEYILELSSRRLLYFVSNGIKDKGIFDRRLRACFSLEVEIKTYNGKLIKSLIKDEAFMVCYQRAKNYIDYIKRKEKT